MKKNIFTILLFIMFIIIYNPIICLSANPGCTDSCSPGEGATTGVSGGGTGWGGKGMAQVFSGIDPRGRLNPMFILGIILLILAIIILASIFVYQRLEQDRVVRAQRDQDWAMRDYANNVDRARDEKERNDRDYQSYAASMTARGDFPMPQEQFNAMFGIKLSAKPSNKLNKSADPIPSSTCGFQVGNNSIGRASDNNVSIDDEKMSSKHADLTITQDGQYVLTDLNSTNGTFVNGQRITQCKVNQGDKVGMGDTTIII